MLNNITMTRGNKILIADDEPDILEIIEFNLQAQGYDVTTAKNGDEAFEKAKKVNPDLIILDIMMPGKNGIEVCNLLRMIPAFKQTLIVFLTALSDEQTEIKGLETGADDYLTKPISPKVLVSKINALFRRLNKEETGIIKIGDLQINREKYSVTFKDADIVYLMEAVDRGLFTDPSFNIIEAYSEIARNYKQAIEQSGIKKVIHLSSIGAHTTEGNGVLAMHYYAICLFHQMLNFQFLSYYNLLPQSVFL